MYIDVRQISRLSQSRETEKNGHRSRGATRKLPGQTSQSWSQGSVIVGQGSRRGPRPRIIVLAKAESNLPDQTSQSRQS
jgi:hypothetical protein